MLKNKLAKIMMGNKHEEMFEKIITSLKDKRYLWNVYTQGSEFDQTILEAVMSGEFHAVVTKHYYTLTTMITYLAVVEQLKVQKG